MKKYNFISTKEEFEPTESEDEERKDKSRLNAFLEETEFTDDEREIWRKVNHHCQLEDLQAVLDDMLEFGQLSQEEYHEACEKADIVVAKYDKWLDYDWEQTMKDAINWVVKGVYENVTV